MKEKILLFLGIKPNDWFVYEAKKASWTLSFIDGVGIKKGDWLTKVAAGNIQEVFCLFEIEFSPSRNRYRMKCSGYDPFAHKTYFEMKERLAELNRELYGTGRKNND